MLTTGLSTVFVFAFALSLGGSFLLAPVAARIARRYNVLDIPDTRKVHSRAIPRLGGIAVVGSIALAFLAVIAVSPTARDLVGPHLRQFGALGAGLLALFLVGVVDDARGVTPRTKLAVQVAAAIMAYAGGFQLQLLPGGAEPAWPVSAAAFLLTVLWITGTTNSVNLIDGLDGLASGIAAIVLGLLGALSVFNGHLPTALAAFIGAGACLGFLRHNGHPARIFLGDSGSLALGFLVATLSLQGTRQGSAVASLAAPLCLLFLPILDSVLAMVRRAQRGLSFAHADNQHIHHRLLREGIAHPRVVQILWGVTLGVGGLALVLPFVADRWHPLLVNVSALAVLVLALRYLGRAEVADSLRALRTINRRRLTPRGKVVRLRRALDRLGGSLTADALLGGLRGVADQLDVDHLSVSMSPRDRDADRVPVFHWDSRRGEREEAWAPEPGAFDRVAATSWYRVRPGATLTVEIGRRPWKARRRSEDAQLWARIISDKLASQAQLVIFCPASPETSPVRNGEEWNR